MSGRKTKTTLMINNVADLTKIDPALLAGADLRIGPFGSVPTSGSISVVSGSGSGSGSGSSPFSGCPTAPGSGPTLTFLPDTTGDPAVCVDPSAEGLHGPTELWVVTNVCPIWADDTESGTSGGGTSGGGTTDVSYVMSRSWMGF